MIALLFAGACGGEKLDVGSDEASGGGSGGSSAGSGGIVTSPDPGPPLVEWPDNGACEPSASAPIDGTWSGYVQGSSEPGDGNFTITFTGMEGSRLCGTVTFGQGEPPPPAVDPTTPYPPGFDLEGPLTTTNQAFPGLPYTMLDASMTGQRLQLTVSFDEVMRSWCPFQTPYAQEGGGYNCLPNRSGGVSPDGCYYEPRDGERVYVSCTQMHWCSLRPACVCDAERCIASQEPTAGFDIHVDGDEAQGTMDGQTLFLERMP